MRPLLLRSKSVSLKVVPSERVFVSRQSDVNDLIVLADSIQASQNATSVLCQKPIRDGRKVVSYSGVIGGVLAVVAYLIRMTSRLPRFGGQLGWDDAVITLAVLEVIPLSVLSVVRKLPSLKSLLSTTIKTDFQKSPITV